MNARARRLSIILVLGLALGTASSTLAQAQDTAVEGANLRGVQFGPGASRLPAGSEELEPISAFLAAHPDVTKLRIEGHANNTGAAKKALALSGRRALAVKDALVALGVEGSRLLAVAFGSALPIADNRTAAGRALNDRVAFEIAERNDQPLGDVTGGGQLVPETPPVGVVDKWGGHYGADGFYYDHFGGYYDESGYQFKDGSYKARCGDRYEATTGKFFHSNGAVFVPPADVRSGNLDDKRGYVQLSCAVAEELHKEKKGAHKASK